ncbi:MAG: hypothetical protein JXB13_01925 [Phycisphaerae bacterium]|nr:hypothetical protein [Phycisphaerae bacterium]
MPPHRFLNDWGQAEWVIPDPGDGGVIPTARSGIVELRGAAGTRVLPPPSAVGQTLVIVGTALTGAVMVNFVDVDGETAVMLSSPYVSASFTTGKLLELLGVRVGDDLRWKAVGPCFAGDQPSLF